MKTIIMAFAILFTASTTTFAQTKKSTSNKSQKTKVATKYTCVMHPEVVQSKPGKCPKCGMKLTTVKNKAAADATASYQCPMKCEGDKTYAKAGKCSICKMDLAKVTYKKKSDGHEGHNHD